MKKETKEWLNKALEDLKVSIHLYKAKLWNPSMFHGQQAVEKAFKALLLERTDTIIKTHDLVLLANKLKAPENIVQHTKELTLAYTYSRYPDMPEIKNIKAKAKIFLKYAKDVIKWVKKQL